MRVVIPINEKSAEIMKADINSCENGNIHCEFCSCALSENDRNAIFDELCLKNFIEE